MGDRDCERAIVAEIRRQDDYAQPVQEVERIDPLVELERQQRAIAAEQFTRKPMLWVGSEPRIEDRANGSMSREKIRQRLRVPALMRKSQRERFRADGDVMRIERRERSAEIAESFLADLRHSPQRGFRRFVGLQNVRIARPVE